MQPRDVHEILAETPMADRLSALICSIAEDGHAATAVGAIVAVAAFMAQHLTPEQRALVARHMAVESERLLALHEERMMN
jgi:hypothetical protein